VLLGLIVQAPSVHAAKRAVTARNLFIEDSMCLCGQCAGEAGWERRTLSSK
jgi:hypothetical protein